MSNPHLDTSARFVPTNDPSGDSVLPPLLAQLASGAAVRGPALARRLGISRAAVWKQVDTLRRAGLDIRAGAAGYRLVHPVQVLDPERVRAALPAPVRLRTGALQNHWRLDSTSSELARRADELPDRSFVFAEWQRAGRGRRGRQWLSPPATNLQFSCLKRFAGGYAALAGLSLVTGIAVVRALEAAGIDGATLKWPNDLVYDGAKLGGILVELGGDFMGPSRAIIGIGINVRVPGTVRDALARPCTDLADVCGDVAPDRGALAAAVIAQLVPALDAFDDDGFGAFAGAWAAHDALAGRAVRVEGARGVLEGVAAGVDARGALRVRTASGIHCVDSGEVSVRPA